MWADLWDHYHASSSCGRLSGTRTPGAPGEPSKECTPCPGNRSCPKSLSSPLQRIILKHLKRIVRLFSWIGGIYVGNAPRPSSSRVETWNPWAWDYVNPICNSTSQTKTLQPNNKPYHQTLQPKTKPSWEILYLKANPRTKNQNHNRKPFA